MDGSHADAAVVAREAATTRRRARLRLPRPASRRSPRRGAAPGRIPYVFEPLGMFRARLRKVGLKRALDSSLYRGVASGAATDRRLLGARGRRRRRRGHAARADRRARKRLSGSRRDAGAPPGRLRAQLGIPDDAPIVLYVGRIAAARESSTFSTPHAGCEAVHVVLAGPDDRHGTMSLVRAAQSASENRGRVHVLPPEPDPPLWLYAEADVFVLASAGDSFGLVAAEAAAAGTPVVVTDRAGIAGVLRRHRGGRRRRRSGGRSSAQSSGCWAIGRCATARRGREERGAAAVVGPRDRLQEEIYRERRLAHRLHEAPRRTARSPSRARARASARPPRAGRRVGREPAERGGGSSTSPAGTRQPFSPSRSRSAAAPT